MRISPVQVLIKPFGVNRFVTAQPNPVFSDEILTAACVHLLFGELTLLNCFFDLFNGSRQVLGVLHNVVAGNKCLCINPARDTCYLYSLHIHCIGNDKPLKTKLTFQNTGNHRL